MHICIILNNREVGETVSVKHGKMAATYIRLNSVQIAIFDAKQ